MEDFYLVKVLCGFMVVKWMAVSQKSKLPCKMSLQSKMFIGTWEMPAQR